MQDKRKFVLQTLDDSNVKVPEWPSATVTKTNAGRSPEGLALVGVRYKGGDYAFPYMKHYTPVLGDLVVMCRVGGNWHVIGSPA
jgi:hypothetical protein